MKRRSYHTGNRRTLQYLSRAHMCSAADVTIIAVQKLSISLPVSNHACKEWPGKPGNETIDDHKLSPSQLDIKVSSPMMTHPR